MSIGIIGTGWGVRAQAPAFKAAGLEVVALAARDQVKTERLAHELGIGFATNDWRALLARDDVQLVSIVTPPNTHKELAIAALEAGKHVLCEKPMALDASETQAMVDAARVHGTRYTLIDHELRFLPAIQLARQQVQQGNLGALRHIETTVIGGGRGDPQREWNWWSDAEQGGGLLGAIGSHQIDLIQFLFGPVAAVSGVTHTFIDHRPSETGARPVTADDYSAILVRLIDGGLGAITMSVVAGVNEPNRLTAHFEHGALRFEGGRLLRAERGGQLSDITPAHSVDVPEALAAGGDFATGTVYLGHALKRALGSDCGALAPAATFEDGHRIQRILDAVRQSSATSGGWVEIID
jgi:predicted dehydrogenase